MTRLESRHLLLEMNTSCNLNCHYCYHYGTERIRCKDPRIFQLPETTLKALHIKEVTFSGGEPLLDFSALETLIDHFCDAHITTELLSNGILLTEENLEILETTGLERISISLDTLDLSTHQRLRGVPVEEVLNAIELIQNHSDLCLILIVVLSAFNADIKAIQRLFTYAENIGVRELYLQPVNVTHLSLEDQSTYKTSNLHELLKEIRGISSPILKNSLEFFKLAKYLQNSEFVEPFYCNIPKRLIYFNVNGLMSSCPIRTDLLRQPINWDKNNLKFQEKDHLKCRLQQHCLCLF